MPKRLLHINNDHHATLVETTNGSKHANAIYAALSYCWGGDQKFKAKRSNLPLLMDSRFLIASLPVVLRETIGLCRKLGLLYLWIDALCIIQDDEDDWTEESARMGRIYQNAHLTIAAGSSNSVEIAYLGNRLRKPGAYERLGLISTECDAGPHLKPMNNRGSTETITIG
ncbi:l-serine dehydratase [Diaporthe eres]|nr:l-serine dehydratase [Diaporthe eres]